MILIREITAAEKRRGGDSTSCSTPSIRYRTDEPVLEGLDVDVGRAGFERVGDDERDQPDHRRLGGEVLQLLDVGVERELVALLDVADDLADGGAPGAVEALQRRVELGRDRDQRLDLAAGHHPEGADRVGIGGIGHRERELVLVLLHRQRVRFAQEARGDALFHDREFRVAGGVDQLQAQLRRERLGDVALRAEGERDEQRAELLAALLLHAQRALEPAASSLPRAIRISPSRMDFGVSFTRVCHSSCKSSGNDSTSTLDSRQFQPDKSRICVRFFSAMCRLLPTVRARCVAASPTDSGAAAASPVPAGAAAPEAAHQRTAAKAFSASASVAAISAARMRRADESRLERRRREVHAGIEHGVEEAVEPVLVAGHHRVVGVGDRGREIEAEHAARRLRGKRHAGAPRRGREAIGERFASRPPAGRGNRAPRFRATSRGPRPPPPGCRKASLPGRPGRAARSFP